MPMVRRSSRDFRCNNLMRNDIKLFRIPGKDTLCTATIKLEFDAADEKAVRRFARLVRELIPKAERAQFAADFQEAAKSAGFMVPA